MHKVSSKWRNPKNTKRNSKRRKAGEKNVRKLVHNKNNRVNKKNRDALEVGKKTQRISRNSRQTRSSSSNQNCNLKKGQSISATSRKLSLFNNVEREKSRDTQYDDEYFIVHSGIFHHLAEKLQCNHCGVSTITFDVGHRYGLASEMMFYCSKCNEMVTKVISSPRVDNTGTSAFEVNERCVDAVLSIGAGFSSLQSICSKLDMNCMSLSTYHSHMKSVKERALALKEQVLAKSREAVRRFYINSYPELSDHEILDIMASYDGTWHTRGFASLFGVGFLIEYNTGLVIDYEVLSKYCHMCTITQNELGPDSPDFALWYENHKESGECNQNHVGSSCSMETKCAEILFIRSPETCKVRVTKVVADGDAKVHKHLCEVQPYSVPISKEECLNHVAKRLTTGLRQVVAVSKSQGITLGGKAKGALTNRVITQLGSYYRSAIVRNRNNVNQMQKDIMATLTHCSSTDEKPNHFKCPKGKSSWCFYNKAKASQSEPKSHSSMKIYLNEMVVECITPVYKRLTEKDLLKRCTEKATQNANEALHSLVWKKCSKNTSSSKDKVEIAAAYAVAEYNLGYYQSEQMLAEVSGKVVSKNSCKIAEAKDRKRKRCSDESSHPKSKQARATRKLRNKQKEASRTRLEGELYGAGLF
ncbi:hypothetical protein QAD02_011490 [Eretmocerus hayati]|uniref:Uncharacterized protein n=3 Tax=Eretmocerus hayati TaxID=131215 RepID=A0ACC2NX31_9HYME|nr:hypothetical protein QAD02_005024 [Eretmocerus hayati]KAJ8675677.1 hypothetical protein QAD02_011463 [Eretmocerus hayati]KAJ8675704.1 hypothetical protein QAD02_011490 [Eretmocerus hayati]